jgi:transcriptional regulator with XRE-family HTH domain
MVGHEGVDNNFVDDPPLNLAAVSAMDLARAARARRAELGLTQEEVRERSGLSVTTIARIESGHGSVKPASLRRYDVALQWPTGTAESWRLGRGGIVSVAQASNADLVALAEQLTPLIARNLRATQPVLTVDVSGLSPEQVAVIEAMVAQLRAGQAHDA